MLASSLLAQPPWSCLWYAGVFLSVAAVWTYTGEAWSRFDGWIYRSQIPRAFWWMVVPLYCVGAVFMSYFLGRLLCLHWST